MQGAGMKDSDIRRPAAQGTLVISTRFAGFAGVEPVQDFHWQVLR